MDGDTVRHKGLHTINDGGYHRWISTMSTYKPDESGTVALELAGRVHESVRKDVECAFGIMKRRHRVLKVPSRLSTINQQDDIFRSCCILHNMIMQFDGLDTLGDEVGDWEVITDLQSEPAMDDNPEGWTDEQLREDILENDIRARLTHSEHLITYPRHLVPVTVDFDRSIVGRLPDSDEAPELECGYIERKKAIATHIEVMFKKRMLMRLKPASECRPFRRVLGCPGPWA